MPKRDVAGRLIEYVWYGQGRRAGPPIVLLHHGFGSVSGWGDFPDRLLEATDRPVLAYSRVGCGRSERIREPRRTDYLQVEGEVVLPELLRSLGITRACLYGHSDGGSIALIAAAERPDLATAVVAEAPHVFIEDITIEGVRAVTAEYESNERFRQAVAKLHEDPDGAFFSWSNAWLSPRFWEWSISDRLGKIQCPVLLVQGDRDPYGTLRQLDAVEAHVAGWRERLVIPDCGHEPHREFRDLPPMIAEFLHRTRP